MRRQDCYCDGLLGILYQGDDRLTEAVDQYLAAIAADDELPLPHVNLGLALFARDKYEQAAAELERALELDLQNAFAHYALGVLYMDYLGKPEGAREHLEKYRSLGGRDGRVEGWLRSMRE